MTRLDLYWMNNDDWYYKNENGDFIIRDTAPQKAKDSFERYMRQYTAAEERGNI